MPERWILAVASRKFLKTLTAAQEIVTDSVPETPAALLSAHDQAVVAESATAVNALLSQVTPQQRMIIVMRMYGFQDIEIARELRTTRRTVRTQAGRARETLRSLVQAGEVAHDRT